MVSRVVVLFIVAGGWGCSQPALPSVENPALTTRDYGVLRIVIESVVRERLVSGYARAHKGRGLVMSPTQLIPLSRDASEPPAFPPPMPALFRGVGPNRPASSAPFLAVDDQRLAPAEISAWRSANRRTRVVPDLGAAGFETTQATAPHESALTVTLSAPAYPAPTSALVYVGFHCGGLCGEGWLVRLMDTQAGWVVTRRERMWIS